MTDRTKPALVLAGCVFIGASTNAYMIVPASIAPHLVTDFAIRRTDVGTAVSAAVFGSVLAQLPSGVLMDRYDNRRLMLGGVAVFALASLAAWLAGSYEALLATRFVGGTMIGLTFTTSANIVGSVFPAERRGVATSAFVASAPVGFAIAQMTSPVVAARSEWPAIFAAWAVVAAVGYGLFRIATPVPLRTGERLSVAEFVAAVRNPEIILVASSAFCAYGVYFFLNTWMPTYANEVLAISLAGAGAVTALVPFVGIVARPGGGWLSDYVNDRRGVIAGSLACELPILFVIIRTTSPISFAVLLLLAGFAAQLSTGVYYAYTQELAPASAQGTSLTVFTTLAFSGSLVSPVLGGWLIDSVSWTATFAVYTVMAVLGACAVLAIPWVRS